MGTGPLLDLQVGYSYMKSIVNICGKYVGLIAIAGLMALLRMLLDISDLGYFLSRNSFLGTVSLCGYYSSVVLLEVGNKA